MNLDCPTETTLQAYAQGKLASPELEVLVAHLEKCEKCAREIAALPQVETQLRDFQPVSTWGDPASTAVPEIGLNLGERLGEYELMEQIGAGGMGVVYVARQRKPIRRDVALKVIKPGTDTREVIARFEAERQALALMDHPNIASVFDAGATPNGLPFFVMELVRGTPITEFCDERMLDSRQRLELFQSVCAAVQHAHQKGVIHRDIKPQNVLVTVRDDKPVAKVIDFGVAKAISHRLTDQSIYTGFAQLVGTPLYMSPEQADLNSTDIDTRSDIYSLGVLLYELLTGQTPIDRKRLKQAAYQEVVRIIREEDPPKPSTRLSSLNETGNEIASRRSTGIVALGRMLRGDLDWIVMKALDKDRTRRYDTAVAFANDIQRHLDSEPVEASPPSALYRVRKLLKRNRVLVVTTSLVFIALLAGIVGTGMAMLRAIDSEEKANVAANAAQKEAGRSRDAVERMLLAVGDKRLRNIPLMDGLRKQLLEEALAFNQEFLDESDSVDDLGRVGQTHLRLASIYDWLDENNQASMARQEARKAYAKLVKLNPNVSEPSFWLAEIDRKIAEERFAQRNLREARTTALESIAAFMELAGKSDSGPKTKLGLGMSYQLLGRILTLSGEDDNAEKAFNDSLKALMALQATEWSNQARIEQATTQLELGALLTTNKRMDEVSRLFESALQIHQELASQNPNDREIREALAETQEKLGGHYRDTGKHKASAAAYQRAVEIFDSLASDFPQIADYRASAGWCRMPQAILRMYDGDTDGATEFFRDSVDRLEDLTRQFPHVVHYQELYVQCLKNLAIHHDNLGDREAALPCFEQAAQITNLLASTHPDDARMEWNAIDIEFRIAQVAFRKDREDPKSGSLLKTAIERAESFVERFKSDAAAKHRLAIYYTSAGRQASTMKNYGSAEAYLGKAIRIQTELRQASPEEEQIVRNLGISLETLSRVLLDQSDTPEKIADSETQAMSALDLRLEAQERFPNNLDHSIAVAMNYSLLGLIHDAQQRHKQAAEDYQKSVAVWETMIAAQTREGMARNELSETIRNQTLAYIKLKDSHSARANIQRAEDLLAEIDEGDTDTFRDDLLETLSLKAMVMIQGEQQDAAVQYLQELGDQGDGNDSLPAYYSALSAAKCIPMLSHDEAGSARLRELAVALLSKSVACVPKDARESFATRIQEDDWSAIGSDPEFRTVVELLD